MTDKFTNLSPEDLILWKQKLKEHCINIISQRVTVAKEAMASAQESANREEKSSAGDKHETARAMSQLERDMNARQLEEATRELELLQRVDVLQLYQMASLGSVVITEKGFYFIASGLGQVEFEGLRVFVVSQKAPVTLALMGKRENEVFSFNNLTQKIDMVF